VPVKWYVSLKDHTLAGFEVTAVKGEDPCEVYLSDYRPIDGRMVPHRVEVRRGYEHYGTYAVKTAALAAK
jgi:hypothetical protein